MNTLAGNELLDLVSIRTQIEARDCQIDNPFAKDAQITAIRGARNYIGDRLIRTAKPHKILDPAHGHSLPFASTFSPARRSVGAHRS